MKKERGTKKKIKKGTIVKIVLLAVVVVAGTGIYISSKNSANAPALVYTDVATIGAVTSELSTSGSVITEQTQTFFAPANVKIASVEVEKGDIVKNGDVLVCFDESTVEYAKKQNELEQQISSANYNANVNDYRTQKEKLANAESEIARLEIEIDNYEEYIKTLTDGISDVNSAKKKQLYKKIDDVQKEIANYQLAIQTADRNTNLEELYSKQTDKNNELRALQNELNLLSDEKTEEDWEGKLEDAKKELADLQTKLQEAKSDKASAKASIVNESKLSELQLTQQKSTLVSEDAEKKYEDALNGVVASFEGVVTQLSAVDGASVPEGTQLVTLERFDELSVEFKASKYDLEKLAVGQDAKLEISGHEYDGKVVKINHMAEPNNSGVPMVSVKVHINNPDENIYLGIEAKVKVITASVENAVLVPVEAVNLDNDGTFCYVIENNVLVKRYVTTGASSEINMQIIDGITDGEEVVVGGYMGMDLSEGMTVSKMPEE